MCKLADMTNCTGKNPAGQSFTFYLVPAEEVESYPQTKEQQQGSIQEMGDDVELVGGFTLKAGGFFRGVKAKTDTAGLSFDLVGEVGSYGFDNKFSFYLTGMSKVKLGFAATVAHCCSGFIVVTEGRDGNTHVLGTPQNPCFIEPFSAEGGKKIAESRGAEYVFKAPSAVPPFIYDLANNPLDTDSAT